MHEPKYWPVRATNPVRAHSVPAKAERRAGVLKDYLVNSGVPANRITAQGKGKTQPVTLPADCTSAQIATVIACLQPDRRVHVEVRGTKIAGN